MKGSVRSVNIIGWLAAVRTVRLGPRTYETPDGALKGLVAKRKHGKGALLKSLSVTRRLLRVPLKNPEVAIKVLAPRAFVKRRRRGYPVASPEVL